MATDGDFYLAIDTTQLFLDYANDRIPKLMLLSDQASTLIETGFALRDPTREIGR